jgi:hypothetical protein
MAHPTTACEEVVRDYIRPIAQKLGGILAELLPDATQQQQYLVAFSIVGQCHFYRSNRAVASLLIGEQEFQRFDVDVVAGHISAFTIRALGLELSGMAPSLAPRTEGVEP